MKWNEMNEMKWNEMKFIVLLQPKGWIATIKRYMYTLAYTIQYDVIKKNAT